MRMEKVPADGDDNQTCNFKKNEEEKKNTNNDVTGSVAVEMDGNIFQIQHKDNQHGDLPGSINSDSSFDVGFMSEDNTLDTDVTSSEDQLPSASSLTSVTITKSTPLPNISCGSSYMSLKSIPCSSTGTSSFISTFSPCSSSITITATSAVSSISSDILQPGINISKTHVPLDMMPTIPLVPVQVPAGRGGIVTLSSRVRGRPRGNGNQYSIPRSGMGGSMRRGGKIKRIGSTSNVVRGGRRLVHSMSLDDKGSLGLRDDFMDDEIQYAQDDMYAMPTIQEKWPGITCAFCCLNELSQLGQGELCRYDATQGFNLPEKAHFTEDVLREASAIKKFKTSQLKDKGKSPRKHMVDMLPEPMEEMATIGHTERPSLAVLFNTNGQCFAHYMCAFWSHGVELTTDDSIACVDKAVVAASERKCSYCKKLGASTKCCVSGCHVWYHFPCATTAGAPMDLKSVSMVCPSHSSKSKDHLVDMACMVCEQSSPESSLLFCSSCGNHYHGLCMKPAIKVTPIVRTGWQCPDCKSCQICRQPGDEIICGICDKSYHAECARPQGLTHSHVNWKCKTCRLCGDCGSRTPGNGLSSRWHSNFSICDSCYQLRNKGFSCPICRKAYRAAMQKSLAQCSICRRHIHSHCDSEADLSAINIKSLADDSYEYTCTMCRSNPTSRLQSRQKLSISSPDRDDLYGDNSQDPSIMSEDSNDLDDDQVTSHIKLPSLTSSSSSAFGGSSSVLTPSPSPNLGLSALSNLQNPSIFDRSPGNGGTGPSALNKGKPFGLARRGGILFPRMRGAVSKFNLGKKGFSSGRKRGTKTMPPARKGRGGNPPGRGYRGYFNYQPVSLPALENNQSSGKEEGEENKLILVNANDKYTLWQDVCAMCGAFGEDQEGRLIACAQCGQCYHPYCANVKVNRVVLEKGWRCLDCTVCEGCGERNDEARLVLCEDCDISCHIYCMTPPLEQVPAGIWKCKWCAVCQYCGATTPGNNSSWQQNYSMCGPCYSMTTCPVCDESYADSELIIQCSDCDRWLHASDDMINTEDEAEKCIEKGYLCMMCRPPESLPPHLLPASPPPRHSMKSSIGGGSAANSSTSVTLSGSGYSLNSNNLPLSPARSESPEDFMSKLNSNTAHWMDGTCLSDLGLNQIKNMTLQPLKKPRNLKGLRASRGPSLDSTGSRDMEDDDDDEDDKMDSNSGTRHWVYRMKEGTLLNAKEHGDPPNLPDKFYTLPGPEPGTFILRKRRCRNIKAVGVGGFQVRARVRKDEEKAREEAEMDPQALELKRKRSSWRIKRKIQILEKFPSYIQEAFFGRNLMDTSNLEEDKRLIEELNGPPVETIETSSVRPSIRLSQDELDLVQAAKDKHEQAKRRKLDGFISTVEHLPKGPQMQQLRVNPPPGSLPISIKEGTIPLSAPGPIQRIEEKKFKEEKVDDIVEDEENNDAIEALFGACGSALISDDLVRDIMNDEIKDEDTSFNEVEDRDPIDGEASVDGSKLTDLLGPGFNLEDVGLADIMKNLREEVGYEGGTQTAIDSTIGGNVSRGVSSIRNQVAVLSTTNTSVAVHPVASQLPQNVQTALATKRAGIAVALQIPSTSAHPDANMSRPNQPMMAPLGTTLPGMNMRESNLITSQLKSAPNVCLQPSALPSPGIPVTYSNHTSAALPSCLSEEQLKTTQQISALHPGYASSAINPEHLNSNAFQLAEQTIPKPLGNVVAQHSPMQNKLVHSVPVHHQSPVHTQQKIYSLNSPIPISNKGAPSGASVTVQLTPSVSLVQNHHTMGRTVPSPSHQLSPVYPSHYTSNDPPPQVGAPVASSPVVTHTEGTTKSWSSSSENQSLSLSLEEDEALGPKATKAAVLYTNIHKPTLKTDVALAKDRERQIKRIWKNLDAEQRKIYATKARENKKEFFKNKQEIQRALKNQEKETAAASGEQKMANAQNSSSQANGSYSQQSQNPSALQQAQGASYAQAPPTPRPSDDYVIQQAQHPSLNTQIQRQDIQQQQQQPHLREVLYQQPKWDEVAAPGGQSPLSSPTRPQIQFRQPLPPMGLSQQLRMRLPNHNASQHLDPRMRLILQQQQQRLQSQQQIMQHLQHSPQPQIPQQSQQQSTQPQQILQQTQQLHVQSSQQLQQPQQLLHQPQKILHQQLQQVPQQLLQQQQMQQSQQQTHLRQHQSVQMHHPPPQHQMQQSPQHQMQQQSPQHQLQQQSPQQHIPQQSPQQQIQQQSPQQQMQQQSPQQQMQHQSQQQQMQQQSQQQQMQQQSQQQQMQQQSQQLHMQQHSPQHHLQQQSPQQQMQQQSPQQQMQQQSPQQMQQQSPQQQMQQQSPQQQIQQHSPQQQMQQQTSQLILQQSSQSHQLQAQLASQQNQLQHSPHQLQQSPHQMQLQSSLQLQQQQSPQQHLHQQQSPQLQIQQQPSPQLQQQKQSSQLQLQQQQQSPQQHQLQQQMSPQHHQIQQQMSPQHHQMQQQMSPQHPLQLQQHQSPQHQLQQQQSPQHQLQQSSHLQLQQQQQSPHNQLQEQSPQRHIQQSSPQHHLHQLSPQNHMQQSSLQSQQPILKSQEQSQVNILSESENMKNFRNLPLDHQARLQQRLLMEDDQKMNTHTSLHHGGLSTMHHTIMHRDAAEQVSELPEAITRELEQFEKEQHRHHEDRQNNKSSELDIEDELLSEIGDIKDLLEYAESERESMGRVADNKLPSNLFDNLVEMETKERKKTESETQQGYSIPSSSMGSSTMVPTSLQSSVVHVMRHSPTMAPSPAMVSSPTMRHSPSLGSSPSMGPSPVHGGPPSGHNSPSFQGQLLGQASTSGTSGPNPGPISPVTLGPLPQNVTIGPSGSMIGMGSARMVVQNQLQNSIASQIPMHLHQQATQGFGNRMLPVSQHIIRQHPTAPPPPPYPGHPPSYSRPQVMPGESLMIRAPIGSHSGGPPVMRPLSHSPVMGSSPMMMGGPHLMPHPQHMGAQLHRRPLLIQEQPLLIEDIIEEEKREQMKQHKAASNQHQQPQLIEGNPTLRPSYQRLPNQIVTGPAYSAPTHPHQLNHPTRPPTDSGLHPALLQAAASRSPSHGTIKPMPITSLPQPPQPPDNPQSEADNLMVQRYESWLTQQNNIFTGHQKHLDAEMAKIRRLRKSLNGKVRVFQKKGQDMPEREAQELERVLKDATAMQKQLEVCRRAKKQHDLLVSEYNKKRQINSQLLHSPSPTGLMSSPQTSIISGASPIAHSSSSPMHSTPQSPLMSHSPSSQHGMCMSPMVPSPHTPVSSPSTSALPQHSPHSMQISHPSSSDHSGPFSPQTRMPSPGTPASYGATQTMVHPMMVPQGMRVRMPVLSPGPSSQSGQMSPHMMVIRQNYSPIPSQMINQSQSQQLVMRHQYQNVMPMRRPSGSGPTPSPVSSGVCLSPGGMSPSPATSMTMRPNSSGPSPSPIPSMAMKPSPIHTGLRSPIPMSSPQMRPHSTENPATPLTPRSVETMGNPLTPHSDVGGYGSQVNSPRNSAPTPTPPSPSVSSGPSFFSNSSMNATDSNIFSEANSVYDSQGEFSFDNGIDFGGDLGPDDNRNNILDNGSSGGGSRNAPFPVPHDMPRNNFLKFGLLGGATFRSRWGHFKIGLRGGYPSPVEECSFEAVTASTSSPTSLVPTTTLSTNITTVAGNSNSPITVSSSEYVKNTGLPEEGLAGVLSDSLKGRLPRNPSLINVSQSAYVSTCSTTASLISQSSVSTNKVVVPEPPKSEIPPSSRHQAIIGIPGGGAISTQSMYPSTGLGVAPPLRLAVTATSGNYNISTPYPKSSAVGASTVLDNVSSSLIPAPIMSVSISNNSNLTTSASKPITSNILSLSRDISTLATVVSASSQINNVLLSLASSTKADFFRSNSPTTAATSIFGNGPLSNYSTSTLTTGGISSSTISRPLHSSVISSPRSSVTMPYSTSGSMLIPSVVNSVVGLSQPSNIGSFHESFSIASDINPNSRLTTVSVSNSHHSISNVPTLVSQAILQSQAASHSQVVYNQPTSSIMTMQTRPSLPHTLHHLPQQRMPVVLTSGNQSIPSLHVVTQQGNTTSGQIVSSNMSGQTRIIGTAIQQQPGGVMVQNQVSGQLPTTQIVQLPSLSQLNTGQLTRAQVVQSINQYGQVVQSSQGGQLIVQHQHQPTSMVLTNSSGHVRMVGQQVMMQQGVLRGSGVMLKSGSQVQGGVMVKSTSQVQGGVRMMMIHNSNQGTLTPPPNSRQVSSPMMPPPAAKSPASHSASPIPRVSPAPSPISHCPSPHSPQIISHSPHQGSPSQSPQHSSTPPVSTSQMMTNKKDYDEEKFVRSSEANHMFHHSGSNFTGISTTSIGSKEVHIPSAPNALLKQLLQNACSSSGVPSQLVLVRSSSAGLSSQLSQVATQLPNPPSVGMARSLPDAVTLRQALHTSGSQNATVVHQQTGIPQLGLTRTTLIPQQTTVVSNRENQSASGLQIVNQSLSGPLPQSVVISHSASNNIITSQVQSGQQVHSVLPSTQYVNVRHGQTLSVQSAGSSTSSSTQNAAVTLPNAYILNQVSQYQGSYPRTMQTSSNPMHSVASLQSSSLSIAQQNSQRLSPSLSHSSLNLVERIGTVPSIKSEMRVMIPETVGNCGGDQTPELHTPNDNCDDPEEAKKAKKRAQSQARRKSQTKDTKVQPAKRARQGSRVEEDYDTYIEGMMAQLRTMPLITVMEPDVPKNFNVCPIYGSGDVAKLGKKNYSHQFGLLEGPEGAAVVKNMNDFYNTQPFGPLEAMVIPAKTGPTQRGFYNQEFTPPKIGLPQDDYSSEIDICLNKSGLMTGRDADSPDTVLSSSSPECVMPESPPPFKGLRLVEDDPMEDGRDRSLSPAIPLLVPIPLYPGSLQGERKYKMDNKNKENWPDMYSHITVKSKIGLSPSLPLKDLGNVTVSLTLSSQASQDVSHVLRSLASLLNIPPPKSYNIIDHSLDNVKFRQAYRHSLNKDGREEIVDMQSILNGQVKFCKQCNTLVMRNIISKKMAEMPFLLKEEYEGIDDLSFCSKSCYSLFFQANRTSAEEKHVDTINGVGRIRTSDGFYLTDNKELGNKIHEWKEDGLSAILKAPQLKDNSRGLKRKLVEEEEEYPRQEDGKRFRGHHYKYWSKDSHILPDKYEKPTNKEMTDLLFGMRITYRMPRLPDDSRQCSLCPLYGDYVADGPSRLLNYDIDKWVHLNCALWAEDVYETMSGSLVNVEVSLKKALNMVCEHCEQCGASVKCFKVRCNKVYHLNCAVKEGCTFYKNKTVYCPEHINKGDKENELSTLAVFRRVYIDRDENRQVASVMHHTEMNHIIRIGSLILLSIGQLLPHHLQAFHSPVCIYPIGYQVIRFYWSMRQLHKRCAYECSIHEVDNEPEFRIAVKEDGFEDLILASRSPKGVWNKVLEPIAEMRIKSDVVRLFSQFISGEDLFGLTEPAIVRILESMPGIDTLSDYNFKYGSNPLFELPLAVNPTGCARAEPFNKTHMKRHHGMRTCAGTVKSGNNPRTAAAIASLTMNFDPFTPFGKQHSRFFQYKKMKNEWRCVVYLARSKIQGLGLYAARDIEKNTAIIEYIGEVIRGELAEVREKRYEAQNRGIYMFRLDDSRVVDATVTGGLARYINHSCGPNCFTETVEIEKDIKIVIVSNRKINRGEELAYDYKFDEEEDHKIPCLCGAENCRKWMN